MSSCHCIKSVHIWSYSGPYFPAFGLNTERYEVSFRSQSECGKIWTRITPNTDTFPALCTAGSKHFKMSSWNYENKKLINPIMNLVTSNLYSIPIYPAFMFKLPLNDVSVSIHYKNSQTLATKLYKVKNDLAPEIISEFFCLLTHYFFLLHEWPLSFSLRSHNTWLVLGLLRYGCYIVRCFHSDNSV